MKKVLIDLLIFLSFTLLLYSGELKIIIGDVGQGNGILVFSPDSSSMIFDCNTGYGVYMKTLLNQEGYTSVDYMVASHYHADHIGGLDEFINAGVNVTNKVYDHGGSYTTTSYDDYVSAVATTTAGTRTTIAAGEYIDMGPSMTVYCLASNGKTVDGSGPSVSADDENAKSVVLKFTYGGFDAFIGGDITGGGNYADVESYIADFVGGIDLYVVSHHGSLSSSNAAIVNAMQPEVSVISVGDGNTYGHPTQTVIDRLIAVGSEIYQTELGSGGTDPSIKVANEAIIITSDGYSFTVSYTGFSKTYYLYYTKIAVVEEITDTTLFVDEQDELLLVNIEGSNLPDTLIYFGFINTGTLLDTEVLELGFYEDANADNQVDVGDTYIGNFLKNGDSWVIQPNYFMATGAGTFIITLKVIASTMNGHYFHPSVLPDAAKTVNSQPGPFDTVYVTNSLYVKSAYVYANAPADNYITKDTAVIFEYTGAGDTYNLVIARDELFTDTIYNIFTLDTTVSLTFTEDTYFWKVRNIRSVGNSEFTEVRQFVIDTTPPILSSVILNNGDEYTNIEHDTLLLELTAAEAETTIYSFYSSFSPADTVAYSRSRIITIPTSDTGDIYVYAKVLDIAGNESEIKFDTIYRLGYPPVAPKVDGFDSPINSLSYIFSGTKPVSTSLFINDTEYVALSADTVWSIQVWLVEGDNYLSFYCRDIGDFKGATYDTQIYVDISPPQISDVEIDHYDTYLNRNYAYFTITAVDTGCGILSYLITQNGVESEYIDSDGVLKITFDTPGVQDLTIRAKDNAGNISQSYNYSLIYDNENPSNIQFEVLGDSITDTIVINYILTGTDLYSGLYKYRLSEDTTDFNIMYSANEVVEDNAYYGQTEVWTQYIPIRDYGCTVYVISVNTIPILLTEGIDYTVDYESGKITFSKGLNYKDVVEVSYYYSPVALAPISDSGIFNISDTPGIHYIYAQLQDRAGNISDIVMDTIYYKVVVRVNSIAIENGASATASETVAIYFDVLDAVSVEIDSNLDFSNAVWEVYSGTKQYVFEAEEGTKTLYFRFKDKYGALSNTYSDSIYLDLSPSNIIDFKINSGQQSTNNLSLTLTVSATNTDTIVFSENENFDSFVEMSYSGETYQYNVENATDIIKIYCKGIDEFGRQSSVLYDTIFYDTQPPVFGLTASDTVLTCTTTILVITADTDVVYYRVKQGDLDDLSSEEWQVYSESIAVVSDTEEGYKIFSVQLMDTPGNISEIETVTYYLKATYPAIYSIALASNAEYTTDTTIAVSITADSVAKYRVWEDSFQIGDWELYASNFYFNLSDSYGVKTVYFQFLSPYGYYSDIYSETIHYIPPPPEMLYVLGADSRTIFNSDSIAIEIGSCRVDTFIIWATPLSGQDTNPIEYAADTIINFSLDLSKETLPVFVMGEDIYQRTTTVETFIFTKDNASPVIESYDIDTVIIDTPLLQGSINIIEENFDYIKILDETTGESAVYFETTFIFSFSDYDGEHIINIEVSDSALNSSDFYVTITFDGLKPSVKNVNIYGGSKWVNSETVTFYITGENIFYVKYAEQGFDYTDWQPFQETNTIVFSAGEGLKYLQIYVKNASGTESGPYEYPVIIDQTAPIIHSISLETADTDVKDTQVTLFLSVDDAIEMNIFTTGWSSGWREYDSFITIILSDTYGELPVHAVFKDTAGNETDTYIFRLNKFLSYTKTNKCTTRLAIEGDSAYLIITSENEIFYVKSAVIGETILTFSIGDTQIYVAVPESDISGEEIEVIFKDIYENEEKIVRKIMARRISRATRIRYDILDITIEPRDEILFMVLEDSIVQEVSGYNIYKVYDITADNEKINFPVVVKFNLSQAYQPEKLNLFYYNDEKGLEPLTDVIYDPQNRELTAYLTHFSKYVLAYSAAAVSSPPARRLYIYPNPVTGNEFMVYFYLYEDATVKFEFYSMVGEKIGQYECFTYAGNYQKIAINSSNLGNDVYFMKMTILSGAEEGKQFITKFAVIK